MKSKIIHFCLSSGLIVITFFLGVSFGEKYYLTEIQHLKQERSRVDVTFSGKTLSVTRGDTTTEVFFNGKPLQKATQTFSIGK